MASERVKLLHLGSSEGLGRQASVSTILPDQASHCCPSLSSSGWWSANPAATWLNIINNPRWGVRDVFWTLSTHCHHNVQTPELHDTRFASQDVALSPGMVNRVFRARTKCSYLMTTHYLDDSAASDLSQRLHWTGHKDLVVLSCWGKCRGHELL